MNITEIFKKCEELTINKRHDYTSTEDNHENFKRSAEIASWFKSDEDKPYAVLIGTKLARLGSLLESKEPKNESIDDTFLDLINYCALWMERRSKEKEKEVIEQLLNPTNICDANYIFGGNPALVRKCVLEKGHEGFHFDFAGLAFKN